MTPNQFIQESETMAANMKTKAQQYDAEIGILRAKIECLYERRDILERTIDRWKKKNP